MPFTQVLSEQTPRALNLKSPKCVRIVIRQWGSKVIKRFLLGLSLKVSIFAVNLLLIVVTQGSPHYSLTVAAAIVEL